MANLENVEQQNISSGESRINNFALSSGNKTDIQSAFNEQTQRNKDATQHLEGSGVLPPAGDLLPKEYNGGKESGKDGGSKNPDMSSKPAASDRNADKPPSTEGGSSKNSKGPSSDGGTKDFEDKSGSANRPLDGLKKGFVDGPKSIDPGSKATDGGPKSLQEGKGGFIDKTPPAQPPSSDKHSFQPKPFPQNQMMESIKTEKFRNR